MRIVAMIGNALRHRSVALHIKDAGYLAGVVIETREMFVPEPPDGVDAHDRELFVEHFRRREEAEQRFFGAGGERSLNCPTLSIERNELNLRSTVDFVLEQRPDVVISYGIHKLSDETLAAFPAASWNTHGGLSPQYRGVITHFWPSYMLEPQMTGMTLHRLSSKLDAGDIVHQTAAPLVRGDGIHDVACRTVAKYGEELRRVLEIHERGELKTLERQRSSGKLWLASDWRPAHLRPIYDLYGDRVVDRYLDGLLPSKKPKLVRQF